MDPIVLACRKWNKMEDKSFGSFNSFLQDTSNRSLMVEVVATNRVANKSSEVFDGVFCNYASFGFDANVAFEFHKEHEQHREHFTSPTKNKMIYLEKSFSSGGLMAFRESKKPPLLKEKICVVVRNEDDEESDTLDTQEVDYSDGENNEGDENIISVNYQTDESVNQDSNPPESEAVENTADIAG